MKKSLLYTAIVAFTIIEGISLADARPDQRYDPGTQKVRKLEFKNIRAGYAIFQNSCKTCHNRKKGSASFLHTESRTMKGWNNVFFKKYANCAKEGSWDSLTPENLLNLNDYLYYNAYDAYDPNDPWENDGFGPFFDN